MGAATKDRIIWDASDVTNSDKMFIQLIDSSLNQIESTDVSGTRGLNVNVLNDVVATCDLDGVWASGTNDDPDNVGIIAHTRSATPGDTQQVERTTAGAPGDDITADNINGLDVNSFLHGFDGTAYDHIKATANALHVYIDDQNGDVSVTATDLDIRDLDYTQDNVEIKDSGGDALAINADGSIDVGLTDLIADDAADSGGSLKVGSRAVDSALTELSAADDRADLLSDLYRRVYINESCNVGIAQSQKDVTSTAASLVTTALSGRKKMLIKNYDKTVFFIGKDASVTTADGYPIDRGTNIEMCVGEHVPVYGISDDVTGYDARILELA